MLPRCIREAFPSGLPPGFFDNITETSRVFEAGDRMFELYRVRGIRLGFRLVGFVKGFETGDVGGIGSSSVC